jgi:hypothetical protein
MSVKHGAVTVWADWQTHAIFLKFAASFAVFALARFAFSAIGTTLTVTRIPSMNGATST